MEDLTHPQQADHLKQEARRYSNILNFSPNAVWQRDEQLKIVYCNMAFSEMAESNAEDLLDISEIELFKGHRKLAEKALETGETQSEEKYIISQGKRRLYRIVEIPADGAVNGYAMDISDVDKAREEIQRHITAQRDFLESSTSAMAVFGADHRLQLYNFSYMSFWRLEETFLDTHPTYSEILEVLRTNRRLPEQANFPHYKQNQLKWFTDLFEPHEEFFYLPDGKTLRVVIIPHALGGLLFAYEDVTDRLALERSYNTLIAVQRETLDNIHESVVVIGEDGRVKLTNPPFLKLWELEESVMNTEPHVKEMLEMSKHLIKTSDWAEYKEKFVAKMFNREATLGKMDRADGKVLTWRKVVLPDGGILLAYNDVTDSELLERSLRERNEALEAADKLKSEFIANMSYELRSPLTSISGFSDILRNEYFGELTDKQREYVEGIHTSSQQLASLINNILDLASIEAGYMQLDLSECDVFEMVESVLALFKERTKVMDIRVLNDCDPEIGSIRADETRIRQVLFNLLSNAVKYSRAGGEIILRGSAEGERIRLCVEDNGVGIAEDKQAHVFERFFRSGAAQGQQSGTGLGLSIVKSFVELHGGEVGLESTPGQGTAFTCWIPRVCAQA